MSKPDFAAIRTDAISALQRTWADDSAGAKVDAVLAVVAAAGRLSEDYSAKARQAPPVAYWSLILPASG